jgi:hypothetical protein
MIKQKEIISESALMITIGVCLALVDPNSDKGFKMTIGYVIAATTILLILIHSFFNIWALK